MTYHDYHLVLEQTSGLCTPLQADTIWGHFTSYLAQKDKALLERFIQTYRDKQPALIFSDGLPTIVKKGNSIECCFPKPADISIRVDNFKEQKKIKRMMWLTKDDLDLVLADNIDEDFSPEELIEVVSHTDMHNQVSRTGQEDTQLYALPETWLSPMDKVATVVWSIFVRVRADFEERLSPYLNEFLSIGYGKKKNIGKGQFNVELRNLDASLLPEIKKANAFIALSCYVPDENDPTEGYWQTFTKYGKTGEAISMLDGHIADNPFKSPIVMLKAGAVFKVNDGQINDYYGVCDLNEKQAIRHEENYIHPTLAFVIPYMMK